SRPGGRLQRHRVRTCRSGPAARLPRAARRRVSFGTASLDFSLHVAASGRAAYHPFGASSLPISAIDGSGPTPDPSPPRKPGEGGEAAGLLRQPRAFPSPAGTGEGLGEGTVFRLSTAYPPTASPTPLG